MARLKLTANKEQLDDILEEQLDTILGDYIWHKEDFDSLKKLCDKENGQIKDLMKKLNLTETRAGEWIAKRVVQTKESLNEERLLQLVKNSALPEELKKRLIKTREYVDMDSLEDVIYTGGVSANFLLELDTCRETKEVVTLRLSKAKEEK